MFFLNLFCPFDYLIFSCDVEQLFCGFHFREEKSRLVENVLRECDNDEDGALCFPEFQQAMAKSPDFVQLFKMYI